MERHHLKAYRHKLDVESNVLRYGKRPQKRSKLLFKHNLRLEQFIHMSISHLEGLYMINYEHRLGVRCETSIGQFMHEERFIHGHDCHGCLVKLNIQTNLDGQWF
jgi:hypothetical protein